MIIHREEAHHQLKGGTGAFSELLGKYLTASYRDSAHRVIIVRMEIWNGRLSTELGMLADAVYKLDAEHSNIALQSASVSDQKVPLDDLAENSLVLPYVNTLLRITIPNEAFSLERVCESSLNGFAENIYTAARTAFEMEDGSCIKYPRVQLNFVKILVLAYGCGEGHYPLSYK